MRASKRTESILKNPVKFSFMIDADFKNFLEGAMLSARSYLCTDLGTLEQGGAVFLLMAQAFMDIHKKHPGRVYLYASNIGKDIAKDTYKQGIE